MNRRLRLLIGALVTLISGEVLCEALPRMTSQAAYKQISRTGELRRMQIDGDLDVAKMRAPTGVKRIVLREVHLEGKLFSSGGGPSVELQIVDQSRVRDIDLRNSHWKTALLIENSVVRDRAWFDGAQFDAAFTLHASVFNGQTIFRNTRFAAPVEITSSQFEPAAPVTSSVSFADARFAAPARFDRSSFKTGVRFDTTRFDADASFIGVAAPVRASWRNVIFGGDAEFRFCRLGDADFGDAEQMSVFMHLADFRGCKMTSLRLDYADIRGDMLLVNAQIAPGDLSLVQASLRGANNDFRGLNVGGRLDLQGAQIANLQLQWYEIRPALLRSSPGSDVLRPLQSRLEELKKDDEAREVSAVLAHRLNSERLAQADMPMDDKATLWFERVFWGSATGYGTRLGRIVGVALTCWLLLALPIALARQLRLGTLRSMPEKCPPLHQALTSDTLDIERGSPLTRAAHSLAYTFALMFTLPDFHLRPVEPVPGRWHAYLLLIRGIGVCLLALIALTLAKVSPIIQAVLGKIVG